MRLQLGLLTAAVLVSALTSQPARAGDPYKWCAISMSEGASTNCYYHTEQQCRMALGGLGGFCQPNPAYTGPEASPAKPAKKSRRR